MSHVSPIERRDGYTYPVLRKTCEIMGWEWREGQKTYRWYQRYVGDHPLPPGFTAAELGHCNHAIQIPGCAYEIGVVEKNEKIHLLYDFWRDGGLDKVLGEYNPDRTFNPYHLTDAYDIAESLVWAEEQGYCAWHETMESGAMKAVIEMPSW